MLINEKKLKILWNVMIFFFFYMYVYCKNFNKNFIHRNFNTYHDSFRINEKILTRLIIHCLHQLKIWIYIYIVENKIFGNSYT